MAASADTAGEAFWRAALAIYARPGAQAALLALQDERGADVMATLWALTAAGAGRGLDAADVNAFASATEAARRDASRLRSERRRLKDGPKEAYAAAKAAELAAERSVAAAAPDPAAAGRPDHAPRIAARNLAVAAAGFSPPLTDNEILELASVLAGAAFDVNRS